MPNAVVRGTEISEFDVEVIDGTAVEVAIVGNACGGRELPGHLGAHRGEHRILGREIGRPVGGVERFEAVGGHLRDGR